MRLQAPRQAACSARTAAGRACVMMPAFGAARAPLAACRRPLAAIVSVQRSPWAAVGGAGTAAAAAAPAPVRRRRRAVAPVAAQVRSGGGSAAAVDSPPPSPRAPSPSSPAAAAPVPATRLLAGVSAQRVERLEALVELKKLYRNCIRAEALLALASPVYAAPEGAQHEQQEQQRQQQRREPRQERPPSDDDSYTSSPDTSVDDEEAERVQQAVELVAEMQLTSEQLKTGLRALPAGFGGLLFGSSEATDAAEAAIRGVAKQYSGDLRRRAAEELPQLPFISEAQAQAACDVRNSRYNRRLQAIVDELGADGPATSISGSTSSLPDRLNQAEKVAGKFVARRIKPALQRAREKQLGEVVAESTAYLRGLWSRLNGGGGRSKRALPKELQLPSSTKKEVEKRISELGLQLEALEKRLVDASKAREAKLRKAGAAGRVAVALQLRSLDAEVVAISRLLAVRTLQLEMEYIYTSLEDEALDVSADELRSSTGTGKGLLVREGSTGELALLVAEYGLLLEQLDVLVASINSQMGSAANGSAAGHGFGAPPPPPPPPAQQQQPQQPQQAAAAAAASGPGLSLIDEDVLEELAAEIPDLRYRVGVSDIVVFGSNPLSPTRLKLQARESSLKVLEGVNFLLRGVRLLMSDVGNGGRLFSKAALGGTLKAREVAALRRTARDLLTFIPFIIILIVPLTPLGHVLVFGFIQRYFPGFFPSQFTNQRQDLMMRYEELQRQLVAAQAAAEAEEEEAELARAAAAVARLTAPDFDGCVVVAGVPGGSPAAAGSPGLSGSDSQDPEDSSPAAASAAAASGGPAAAKLRQLEEQVEEAREEVHSAPEDGPAGGASVQMRH